MIVNNFGIVLYWLRYVVFIICVRNFKVGDLRKLRIKNIHVSLLSPDRP